MKLGSIFVKRRILGEILLYVATVVYRDREYSNFKELLCVIVYIVFRKNSIFCPSESILIYLSCTVKCGSITGNSWKKKSSCCGFCNESANQFYFSPLMSVLLQLTHKTKILPWWFSDPTRYFHTWISSGSFYFNS